MKWLAILIAFFVQLSHLQLIQLIVFVGGCDSLFFEPIQKRPALTLREWVIYWRWFHFLLLFLVCMIEPFHFLIIQPLFES